jgi:hypothetical protein
MILYPFIVVKVSSAIFMAVQANWAAEKELPRLGKIIL